MVTKEQERFIAENPYYCYDKVEGGIFELLSRDRKLSDLTPVGVYIFDEK